MSLLNKIEQFLADYDRINPPEKQAKKEMRSVSNLIIKVMEEYLDQVEEEQQ